MFFVLVIFVVEVSLAQFRECQLLVISPLSFPFHTRFITAPFSLFGPLVVLTYFAVDALPAVDALLVPSGVAAVMSELVVAGAAELGARQVEVVRRALDSNPVRYPRGVARPIQSVPVAPGHDNA